MTPKKLFLVDGIGALVTASMTGLVLPQFIQYIGLGTEILYVLGAIAGIFAIYSLGCFLFLTNNWTIFLRVIAIANSVYCFATLGIIFYYYDQMRWPGIIYFVGEIILVASLIYIELKMTKKENINFIDPI